MTNKKYVIGVDFGTLSGRCVIAEAATGKLAASSEASYPHGVLNHSLPSGEKLGNDWALQIPSDYLYVLETTIKEAMKKSPIDPSQIIGLATDFTACTCLPVDKNLIPLCEKNEFREHPHAYVKLWKHHAAKKEAEEITQLLDKYNLLNEPKFGGKVSSEILLPKILQILREDQKVYQAADQILEAPDWISQLLTGTRKRSGSTACYKAMWDPENGYPSSDFLKKLDPALEHLADEKLSNDICFIGQKIGTLNQAWATRLGLPAGISIAPNIIDAHAGLVSCGVTSPGQMLLILGTSTAQTLISKYPYSKNGVLGGVKDQIIPGYYALESGLASAGDTLQWFVSNCVPHSYIKEAQLNFGGNIHALLCKRASAINPGDNSLIALDWFNGNKTPYVDADRSGVIVGLTLTTKPEDIYRALIESMAFSTRVITEQMECSGTFVKEIFCCGGIAEKNEFFMQIFADVLQRDLYIVSTGQTAALGAAIYAAVAAGSKNGGYDSVYSASKAMHAPVYKKFSPDSSKKGVYDSLYNIFLKLEKIFAPASDDIMFTLKEISKLSSK